MIVDNEQVAEELRRITLIREAVEESFTRVVAMVPDATYNLYLGCIADAKAKAIEAATRAVAVASDPRWRE